MVPCAETSRREYERYGRLSANDMQVEEWALLAPFTFSFKPAGRPPTTALRNALDALRCTAAADWLWPMISIDIPPPLTVQR